MDYIVTKSGNKLVGNDYRGNIIDIDSEVHLGDYISNNDKIKNLIGSFVGIIQFNSKKIKTYSKKSILKEFIPFFGYFENIWVKINKTKLCQKNTYAIVEIDWENSK